MELTQLGRSGLTVSRLAFGAMTFGDRGGFARLGGLDVQQARRLVEMCLDAGVTLFDTADAYAHGASEEVLGAALGGRRDEAVVATKGFQRMGPGPHDLGSSRRHLVRACEASLRRLGTDHVDLYQLHGFDDHTPLEETLEALEDLVRSGKVRYVGCSNFAAWQLMKALGLADRGDGARLVSHQIYYSLVGRDAEHELLPLAVDQQVGTIVWSPLAFGLLTGKYARGLEGTGRLAVAGRHSLFDQERGDDIVDALRTFAAERQRSVAQVAINWLLHKPGVSTVILGARNAEQLGDNLEAVTWSLTRDEVEELDALSAVRRPYPLWAQEAYAGERHVPLASYRPSREPVG